MPSDDLILNVRQIAGYGGAATAQPSDVLLLQRGGLGGPYYSITPEDFVGTALSSGGDMTVGGTLTAFFLNGGSLAFPNGVINVLSSNTISVANLEAGFGTIGGQPIATVPWVTSMAVTSFNQRRGDVVLDLADIVVAGGAPANSPVFYGEPQAPTPPLTSNDNTIATTAFVQQNIGGYLNYWVNTQPLVFTFNGRSGDVTLQASDLNEAGLAPLDSPAFTGTPTAPTAPPLTDNNQIATTAYVDNAITNINTSHLAPIDSPAFTGYVTAPTPPPGTTDGQVATTAFVMHAVTAATAGVSSFNTRTGAVVLTTADITGAGGAVLASPAFSGVPTAPTAAPGTNTQQLATTAYVTAALAGGGVVTSFNTRVGAIVLTGADISAAGGALLSSPALTGTPTAPTATAGTTTTQLATTQFVANAIAAVGTVVQSFNGRSGAVTLAANDISAAGGAVLASPSFSGTPTAPTANPGTSTAQIATTAFVTNALAGGAGVSSFNSRTGAVVLTTADITGAGGAPAASPTFTGTPAVPTAAPGTNTTQAASTAFVTAALTSGAVSSFNTRTGAVVLSGADITSAGGALLASPGLTGVPTAPTAAAATNTTQIATTAFVQAAISAGAGGVLSFNSRTGAVTLQANDLSAVGGALLASPAFTGNPTAPTPSPGDNDTSIATTAFVAAALATAGGVTTFNGRAGAVSLTTADITGAGGAPIASPAFTGTATANIFNPTQLNVQTTMSCTSNALFGTTIGFNAGGGITGLTDGNSAAAGQVGQMLNANGSPNVGWGTNTTAATMTLPPGDWDVWGTFNSNNPQSGNAMTFFQANIQKNASLIAVFTAAGPFTAQSQIAGQIPMTPVIQSASSTLTLVLYCQGSGGAGFPVGCNIYARRRR